MINYELALTLKKAGFPFRAEDLDTALTPSHDQDCECLPTLSELIEACGERFRHLTQGMGGLKKQEPTGAWIAESTEPEVLIIYADTPSEAVAKLWLEINRINDK